ncbi:MAG: hypothetical protein U0929_14315 [Planctomycetaceae bacterium]
MISDEVEDIRQTFRVTLTLSGAAAAVTYLLADKIGFNNPLQAGLVVLLASLMLLAVAILMIVLTQRFCEVLEVEEPPPVSHYPPPRPAVGILANSRKRDGSLDLYLHRIYREVAPGDRSYIRKGGLNPNRPKTGPQPNSAAPATTSTAPASGLYRSALSPRPEPYRTATVEHPKPHREPRT